MSSKLLNYDELLLAIDGEKEFAGLLIQEFLKSSPRTLESLRKAIQENDYNQIKFHAHALKGSCRTMRIASLANICEEIENRCKDQLIDSMNLLMNSLEHEFDDLSIELNQYLEDV
jgi:HPt (histidine-containing phosphotransfer) domain-containing protein